MTFLNFTHYESFGGSLLNNTLGLISSYWSNAYEGGFLDPTSMLKYYFVTILLLCIYLFIKTWSIKESTDILFNAGEGDSFSLPHLLINNVITKTAILMVVFYTLLRPIPVIQMTPIIGYETNGPVNTQDTERGASSKKVVLGWLVNENKTGVHKNEDGKDEVLLVPQILFVLGAFESVYYGFPAVENEKLFDPLPSSQGGALSIPKTLKEDLSRAPTFSRCLSPDNLEKFKKLESSLYARLDIGSFQDLNIGCQKEFKEGDWYDAINRSLLVLLFGPQSVAEILSDFFEPIDKFYYFMSFPGISEMVNLRFAATADLSATKAAQAEFTKSWDYIRTDVESNVKALIGNIDKQIYEEVDNMAKDLDALKALSPKSQAQPQETIDLVRDSVLNYTPLEGFWRKNQPSITLDGIEGINAELIGIKNTAADPATGNSTGLLLALENAERKVIINSLPETIGTAHQNKIKEITTKNTLELVKEIYTDAQKVFADLTLETSVTNENTTNNGDIEVYVTGKLSADSNSPGGNGLVINNSTTAELGTDKVELTKDLGDVQKTIWAYQKMVLSRKILLSYVKRLRAQGTSIKEPVDRLIKVISDKPQTSKLTPEALSLLFRQQSSFVLRDNTPKGGKTLTINGVYLDMYPSKFYERRPKLDPKDKTAGVMFLPLSEVLAVLCLPIVGDTRISNCLVDKDGALAEIKKTSFPLYKRPITKLSVILGSNIWGKKQSTLFDRRDATSLENNPQLSQAASEILGPFIRRIQPPRSGKAILVPETPLSLSGTTLDNWNGDDSVSLRGRFDRYAVKWTANQSIKIPSELSRVEKTIGTLEQRFSTDLLSTGYFLQEILSLSKSPTSTKEFSAARLNALQTSFSLLLSNERNKEAYLSAFKRLVLSLKKYTVVLDDDAVVFNEKTSKLFADEKVKIRSLGGISETLGYSLLATREESYDYISILSGLIEEEFHSTKTRREAEAKAWRDAEARKPTKEKGGVKCQSEYDAHAASGFVVPAIVAKDACESEYAKLLLAYAQRVKNPNPPLSKDFGGVWSSLVNLSWGLASAVLHFPRQFQNTTTVQVKDVTTFTDPQYNPNFIFGYTGVFTPPPVGAETKAVTDYSYSNPNFLVPSVLSSAGDFFVGIKDLALNSPWLSGFATGASLVLLKDASVLVVIALTVSAATLLLLPIFYLALYILKILLLGTLIGMFGLFRAIFLVPISLILGLLSYDLLNKRVFKGLEGLHQAFPNLMSPVNQIKLVFKQLSGWVIAVGVLVVISYLSEQLINPILQEVAMTAWLDGLLGKDLSVLKGVVVSFLLLGLNMLILAKAFDLIGKYFESVIIEDPILNSVKEYAEQQKQIQTVIKKTKSLGSKLKENLTGIGKKNDQ